MHPSTHKPYKILGRAIEARRKELHLTQEQLAEKANLTRNYIGNVERAEKQIAIHTLSRLAKALNCRFTDLTQGL